MKTFTHSTGVSYDWDDELQAGDLITTCNEGVWRLEEITEREGNTPLFHVVRVYDSKGKPSKKLKSHFDASHCRKARIFVREHIKELEEQLAAFKAML